MFPTQHPLRMALLIISLKLNQVETGVSGVTAITDT